MLLVRVLSCAHSDTDTGADPSPDGTHTHASHSWHTWRGRAFLRAHREANVLRFVNRCIECGHSQQTARRVQRAVVSAISGRKGKAQEHHRGGLSMQVGLQASKTNRQALELRVQSATATAVSTERERPARSTQPSAGAKAGRKEHPSTVACQCCSCQFFWRRCACRASGNG